MIRRLAPILAAGLVLAACGSGDAASPSAATADTTTAPPGSAPATAAPADAGAPSEQGEVATTPPPTPASTDGATEVAPPDSGSAVAPVEAPAALQFSAPLLGGGDIELTTLAGRPVLLWFWAPW